MSYFRRIDCDEVESWITNLQKLRNVNISFLHRSVCRFKVALHQGVTNNVASKCIGVQFCVLDQSLGCSFSGDHKLTFCV